MIEGGQSGGGAARRTRAFTLVEVVVASGLAVVVAVLALGTFNGALSVWQRAQDDMAHEAAARRILDQVERDLQGMIACEADGIRLAATIMPSLAADTGPGSSLKPAAESLNPAAPRLQDARFGAGGVWLRLFTQCSVAGLDGDSPAAPIAVAYGLVRHGGSPVAGGTGYALCRVQTAAGPAFVAGYDLTDPAYTATSAPGDTQVGLRLSADSPVFADGVIDFGVRFFRSEADADNAEPAWVALFPRADAADEFLLSASTDGAIRPLAPEVAEIFVRMLTTDGARRLAALEQGRVSGDWWTLALAHSRVFTRRIRIQPAPLDQ